MFRRRSSPRRIAAHDGPDFSLSILLTLLGIILWGIGHVLMGGGAHLG